MHNCPEYLTRAIIIVLFIRYEKFKRTFTVSSDFFLPLGLKRPLRSFCFAFWAVLNWRSKVAPPLVSAPRLAINCSKVNGFSEASSRTVTSAPHSPQNLDSALSAWPQFWQNIVPSFLKLSFKVRKKNFTVWSRSTCTKWWKWSLMNWTEIVRHFYIVRWVKISNTQNLEQGKHSEGKGQGKGNQKTSSYKEDHRKQDNTPYFTGVVLWMMVLFVRIIFKCYLISFLVF